MVGDEAMTKDNWRGVDREVPRSDKPFPVAPVSTQSAEEAYRLLLGKVGAIYPKRDAVDIRIINDVKNSTGRIINSQQDVDGYPDLGVADAPVDTDHDGMPDEWEKEYGFNPNNAADGA